MSPRTTSNGLVPGLLSPTIWDKMLSEKVGLITHFGYFRKNDTLPDIFIMRVEQEDDVDGLLVRVEAFTDIGIF